MKKIFFSIIIFLSLIFLVGFDIQNPLEIEDKNGNYVQIQNGEKFGQTFTSLHAGLDGISINVTPPDRESNQVKVRLYENTLERELISQKTISLPYKPGQNFYKIQLPVQKDSYLKDYFLVIEWDSDHPLTIITAPAESYDQGALYIEGAPVEAQLGFILHYDLFCKILGLIKQSFTWLWYLILTVLVFILPGWAFLRLTWNSWGNYNLLVKTVMAAGLSFAMYPVLLLLTDFVGFHPGKLFFVWVPLIVSFVYLLWGNHKKIQRIIKEPKFQLIQIKERVRSTLNLVDLTTLIVVLFVIILRIWVIRTLEVPLWGDSYQHTMITQLILDNNGLFESWLPYVPYESLSIHFGFHVNSAIFAWISKSTAAYAVIWMGQIANIFAVLALYPLALRLTRNNKWIGCCAMFVSGLLLELPLFYVNWGRYPQLMALVLLPVAFFMLLETLFTKDNELKKAFTTSIVLTGMTLSYYRSPFFMLIFLPGLVFEIISWINNNQTGKTIWIWKSLLIITLMTLLLIPLIPNISQGELVENVNYEQTSTFTNELTKLIVRFQNTTKYYHWIFLTLAALAAAVAVITKQWHIVLLPLGVLLLQGYGLGTFINLPFSNFSNVFSIIILLYIPLAMLIGYVVAKIVQLLSGKSKLLASIVIIFLSLFSLYFNKNLVNKRNYEYVTWADQRAFKWIKNNTDESALFLVDGFNIYNGTSSVGSDGGWWISLLAERDNTIPPQYALLNESPIEDGYSKRVVEIINTFSQTEPATNEGISAMCQWEISHIYIGQKQGLLNQTKPLLDWRSWSQSSALDLIYEEDRVKIFAFDMNLCKKLQDGP